MSGIMLRREPTLHTLVTAFGALYWFIGNGLYLLDQSLFRVIFWLIGLFALTISAERLGLNRRR